MDSNPPVNTLLTWPNKIDCAPKITLFIPEAHTFEIFVHGT